MAAIGSHFADPPHPREVIIQPGKSGLRHASAAVLNQIRSVARKRLMNHLGIEDAATMRKVDDALKISLGLVSL